MMRPEHGIATDGAHSMKRGVTRYRAIDLATGELLFEQNIRNQTFNIGEFLGVVENICCPLHKSSTNTSNSGKKTTST